MSSSASSRVQSTWTETMPCACAICSECSPGPFVAVTATRYASAPETTMPPKAGFMGGIAYLLSGLAPSSSEVESPRIPGRFKTPKWWRAQHAPPHRQVVTSELAPEL
jgi:hypothetical protein